MRKVPHGSRTIKSDGSNNCRASLFEHIGVSNERYRPADKYICFNNKKKAHNTLPFDREVV